MSIVVPGYRIGQQIATGAGSRIYRATEAATGKPMAVKRVVRESPDDDRFLAQLEVEYEVTSKLEHPVLRRSFLLHRVRGILAVKEALLVMEFVDGLSMEKARPNRLLTFLNICMSVAEGLSALHESGFVHSDIKPNNIMIARGAQPKIIDFGQSCAMGAKKERIQGTPDYIAPEQVHRRPLDRRTDVFNLGATMYWLLTSENYPTALAQEVTSGKALLDHRTAVAPVELNDKIPRPLSNLVMECCREDPAVRPADMRQVAGRLDVIRKQWLVQRENVRAAGGETSKSQKVEKSKADGEGEAPAEL